ncbi:hypothetical protein BDU57DRAFT_552490 [Ampelomyces quisqualis]|uniref:Uncharacterized protein n=1 Tax=Ampelomyces quisqualis TaxID=50730 RepID=A0A6A5Q5C0_AMPQU|nr:hypothetical protein BDU57DRAFT_552490 [Ampelomyces quisqualis]
MVTLYTIQVVTIALLVSFAHPSHAAWNVYSRFLHLGDQPEDSGWRGQPARFRYFDSSDTTYDVGNKGCFNMTQGDASYVQFSKRWGATEDRAKGPYCLQFYFGYNCTNGDMEGDNSWEYKNIYLNKRGILETVRTYEVGFSGQAKMFKWINRACINPSKRIDDKVGDKVISGTTTVKPGYKQL